MRQTLLESSSLLLLGWKKIGKRKKPSNHAFFDHLPGGEKGGSCSDKRKEIEIEVSSMNCRDHQAKDKIVRGVAPFEHLTTHVFHKVADTTFFFLEYITKRVSAELKLTATASVR